MKKPKITIGCKCGHATVFKDSAKTDVYCKKCGRIVYKA